MKRASLATHLAAILGALALATFVAPAATSPGALSFTNTPLQRPDGNSEPEISIASNGTMGMVALSFGLAPDMQFGTNLWIGPFGSIPAFQGIIDGTLQQWRAESEALCSCHARAARVGLRCFISTKAQTTSWLGLLGEPSARPVNTARR